MHVVINVDDLGLHPAVRRAVERLAGMGRVTSASVLANGSDVENAARVPGVSLGAHLNILRGRPLSPRREVPSLVDGRGLFPGGYTRLWRRVILGQVRVDEVRLEWSRQVERLLELGITLSHLDGEKHTHCWPALMPVACDVARAYGIPWVRRPWEPTVPVGSPVAMLRTTLLRRWCARATAPEGVRFPDASWGIFHQGAQLDGAVAARTLRRLPPRSVVEIVCHPGWWRDGDPPIDPDMGRMRVRSLWEPERLRLEDETWARAVADAGWTLSGFDRLPPPPARREGSDAPSPPNRAAGASTA